MPSQSEMDQVGLPTLHYIMAFDVRESQLDEASKQDYLRQLEEIEHRILTVELRSWDDLYVRILIGIPLPPCLRHVLTLLPIFVRPGRTGAI